MPKASKETASQTFELEGFEAHAEDFGPFTVSFETYTADAEFAPLFVGLPDDRCQSRHWGYVFKGRVTFGLADGTEEVYSAGDAYYVPPGHRPKVSAGTELVEFSPSDELAQTIEVVMKNMEAAAS